jgi:hypothetical protein
MQSSANLDLYRRQSSINNISKVASSAFAPLFRCYHIGWPGEAMMPGATG